jgi:hypothetical protein
MFHYVITIILEVNSMSLLDDEVTSSFLELPWSSMDSNPFQLSCYLQGTEGVVLAEFPMVDLTCFDFSSGLPMVVRMPFDSVSGEVTMQVLFDVTDAASKENQSSKVVYCFDSMQVDFMKWHSVSLMISVDKTINLTFDGKVINGILTNESNGFCPTELFLARHNKSFDNALSIYETALPRYMKTLVVTAQLDHADPSESTRAFIHDITYPVMDSGESGDIPIGFYPAIEYNIVCCNGRANFKAERIKLPLATIPAIYSIEIADATNPACFLKATTTENNDDVSADDIDSLHPIDSEKLLKCIETVDTFSKLKINVVAK